MTSPMTPSPTPEALRTWMQVIALLVEAADRATYQAATHPAVHSLAVAADGVAARAISLLPPELDDQLEALELGEATARLSVAGLIRAAEAACRRHPIEQLPPGACGVIVELGDLVGQAGS